MCVCVCLFLDVSGHILTNVWRPGWSLQQSPTRGEIVRGDSAKLEERERLAQNLHLGARALALGVPRFLESGSDSGIDFGGTELQQSTLLLDWLGSVGNCGGGIVAVSRACCQAFDLGFVLEGEAHLER